MDQQSAQGDEMPAYTWSVGLPHVRRIPASDFAAHLVEHVQSVDAAPDHDLELHLVDTQDKIAAIAMDLERFDALLAHAETVAECGAYDTSDEFQYFSRRESPTVIVEEGGRMYKRPDPLAVKLIPPPIYETLLYRLHDSLLALDRAGEGKD